MNKLLLFCFVRAHNFYSLVLSNWLKHCDFLHPLRSYFHSLRVPYYRFLGRILGRWVWFRPTYLVSLVLSHTWVRLTPACGETEGGVSPAVRVEDPPGHPLHVAGDRVGHQLYGGYQEAAGEEQPGSDLRGCQVRILSVTCQDVTL